MNSQKKANPRIVQFFSYGIVFLVLAGALLTACATDQMRFVGFSVWVVTNIYWLLYNLRKHEIPLAIQFALCLFFAFMGMWNNRGWLL